MSKKLKVGIIGAGGIATIAHMPAYAGMENVEVVAICDIVPEKAKTLAEKYNVSLTFENYMDLLALPELDAVDICTPNYLHSTIAVAALILPEIRANFRS